MRIAAATMGLFVLAVTASAHHSGAAIYVPTAMTEIEGEISRIFWRNPHVHFLVEVTDADGGATQWDVESNSVSILGRMGVSPEVLGVGDRVRVAGWPARRPVAEMFATNLLLPGGREVLLNPQSPARWTSETLGSAAALVTDGGARDADASGDGIFRVWSTNMANPASFPLFNDVFAREENYPLTAAAREARESWDPVADNPYLSCTPMGMPRVMGQPYPIEFVERGGDIVLRIELHDIERAIRMDTPAAPGDVPRSPLGHSVGRWQGEALVVTTNRIDWPYFDQSGVPLGEDAQILERFTPSADGNRLDYSLTVTDPATFTQPVVLEKYWTWRPGERVNPFDCVEWQRTR